MRKISLTFLAISIVAGFIAFAQSAAQSRGEQTHSEWIAQSLKEIETIKPGMTRADLLKVFGEEGVYQREPTANTSTGNVHT